MIDAIVQFWEKAASSRILEREGLGPKSYLLMTMHRPGNVDSQENLQQLVQLIEQITLRVPILLPLHPRTAKNLQSYGLLEKLTGNGKLKLIEPLGYLDFLYSVKNSLGVISDSGGVQAETTFLNVPCLTLRETTEQPVTVELGTNTLVGLDAERILSLIDKILRQEGKSTRPIPLWDGKTAQRIAKLLLEAP